jgi:hypothetical protein
MNDNVSIEAVVSVLRYHPDGGGYGSPSTFSCLMLRMADEVTLYGGSGIYNRDVRREIKRAMLDAGVSKVQFQRITEEAKRIVTIRKERRVKP